MSVPKIFNTKTGKWEPLITSNTVPIVDKSGSFEADNVEGALQELAAWRTEMGSGSLALLTDKVEQHEKDIQWLKANGGGGGGGGAVVPTITSTIPEGTIKIGAGEPFDIPIFFSSANLGDGTAYITVNNKQIGTQGVVQGNNVINIESFTELKNTVTVYVKDRAKLLSNNLTWTVINGGIDLELDFDSSSDFMVGTEVIIPYRINSAMPTPVNLMMTIDYDEYVIPSVNGYNDYSLLDLGAGLHNFKLYATDGEYVSKTYEFSLVMLDSKTLYVSSSFDESDQIYGTPITIPYRISFGELDKFPIKTYIDGVLIKELLSQRGNYYWVINDRLDINTHTYKIEVDGTVVGDEVRVIEGEFNVVAGPYVPVDLATNGLIYRLNPATKTNKDIDKQDPILNGVQAHLHNFNFSANGWVDGDLVCTTGSYMEIDLKPYLDNVKTGSTVEIYYESFDIGNADALVVDYRDNYTDKGFSIGLDECNLGSESHLATSYVHPSEWTKVSFVIDRRNKFGKIFVNGVCSRAFDLKDSGSGIDTKYEDFSHDQKMYINYNRKTKTCGSCRIKDILIYRRALTDDEIVKNGLYYESDLRKQELQYNFEYNNTTLPEIRMYGDDSKMTLANKVTMRVKYISTDTEKYGQSFDLPYCEVGWQGTSSVGYVLKNYQVYLKDENLQDYYYTPFPNSIPEKTFCFKCDYMESSHSRNVGLAKFANDIIFDEIKNPAQIKDSKVRNSVIGFPIKLYVNDELKGAYNFNYDRYSNNAFGYTDPNKHICYEVSANSDTTAGAFFCYEEERANGKTEHDYYASDFIAVYPTSRQINDDFSEIKRLIEFVDKSGDEDFVDNFENYFNKEYVLRYMVFVHLFGLVDNLGKNMKLTTWDGRIWYIQPYDCDTSIGLDNSGFQKFDMDIEIGQEEVFNTTTSRLWTRIQLLMPNAVKEMYAHLRNANLNYENALKYLVDEQIDKIPSTLYNQDMQSKYLNFGSSYLYALHGSSRNLIRNWLRDRFTFMDSLYQYDTDNLDYVTIRSSKLGYVYLDVQTFCPMYFTVKWRNEANDAGVQRLKVNRGETVRFDYVMPTATDQEIIIYGGKHIKSLGDLSNLEPTTMLVANAYMMTGIECHSKNLINTDISTCYNLVNVDLSNCVNLGNGVGAQQILDITNCENLLNINIKNTALRSISLNPNGSDVQEIWLPSSIQSIKCESCMALTTVGFPLGHTCKSLKLVDCPNVKFFGDLQWDPANEKYKLRNGLFLGGLSELYLDNSYDVEEIDLLYNLGIEKMTLRNLVNVKAVTLGMRVNVVADSYVCDVSYYPSQTVLEELGDFKMDLKNCPNLEEFNLKTNLGRSFYPELTGTRYAPSCKKDPLGYIEYRPDWNLKSGFHCRNLDLSNTTIKRFNMYICSYIKCLALPTTIEEIHINSKKNMVEWYKQNGMHKWREADPYRALLWSEYGQSVVPNTCYNDYNWWGCEGECIGSPVIWAMADSIDNCTSNIWKMDSFNLKEFELGPYNSDTYYVDNVLMANHKLTIQDLHLQAEHYTPCLSSRWLKKITGTLDLSKFKGDYLIRCFDGITDELNVIIPEDFDFGNVPVINAPLRRANTTQFDWKFAAKLFSYDIFPDRSFEGTTLKEQSSSSEAVSFINTKCTDGWLSTNNPDGVYDNVEVYGIFGQSNIKYINEFTLGYVPSQAFNSAKKLVSIGNSHLGKGMTSFNRTPNAMFRACSNLQTVGTINIDFNNLVYTSTNENHTLYGMFESCNKLNTIGKITYTNVNSSMSDLYNNSGTYINMGAMYNGCTNLRSIPTVDINRFKVSNMNSFAKSCKLISSYRLHPISSNCSLSGAFEGCTGISSIDFSNSGISTGWSNDMTTTFKGCSNLSSLNGFNLPLNSGISQTFNGCGKLPTYYHNNTLQRYYSYNGCTSMKGAPETHEWVWTKNDTGGIDTPNGYVGVQGFKNVTISIEYTQKVLNTVPNKYTNKVELDRCNFNSDFQNCKTIENVTLNWLSPLGVTYFRNEMNFQDCFKGNSIKTLTFNEEYNENISSGDNRVNVSGLISGSEDTILTIENYPLNALSGQLCGAINTQFQSITWQGTLYDNWNINTICSGSTINIPIESLNDLLTNHLETVSEKNLILGPELLSMVSEEAKQAATNKGWTLM